MIFSSMKENPNRYNKTQFRNHKLDTKQHRRSIFTSNKLVSDMNQKEKEKERGDNANECYPSFVNNAIHINLEETHKDENEHCTDSPYCY